MMVKNECQCSDQKEEKGTKLGHLRICDISVYGYGYVVSTKDWNFTDIQMVGLNSFLMKHMQSFHNLSLAETHSS